MRLAALFSHPIQYFAPLFRHLAAQPGIDLTVFYCSRQSAEPRLDPGFQTKVLWDIPLLEGYNYQFLPNLRCRDQVHGFFSLINPAIFREIWQKQWDALWVHGYMHATNIMAIMAAKAAGVPVFLRGESTLLDLRPPGRQAAKAIALGLLLRLADAALYVGTQNRNFYLHYGMPAERLFFAPYTVDNNFFQAEAIRLQPQRQVLREGFGVADDRPIILFCGKLVPKKQPLLLLEAYAKVRMQHPCTMLFAGDGPLRPEIETIVSRQGIPDVHITGFLNQTEISHAYTAADLLVLPSAWGETWGLVINEAMNFGLPIIASDRVGGTADLVREGENGHIIPFQDSQALALAITRLVMDSSRRQLLGEKSRQMIKSWSLQETVTGIKAACFQSQK